MVRILQTADLTPHILTFVFYFTSTAPSAYSSMQKNTDIRRTRIDLVTEVKLSFPDVSGFAKEYSSNISLGGIFIQSERPQPMGSRVELEFVLDNNTHLIRGVGEVVWTRPVADGPDKPSGMGIRFQALDKRGRELILRLMEGHIQEGGEPFDIRSDPVAGVPSPAANPGAAGPEAANPGAENPGAENVQAGATPEMGTPTVEPDPLSTFLDPAPPAEPPPEPGATAETDVFASLHAKPPPQAPPGFPPAERSPSWTQPPSPPRKPRSLSSNPLFLALAVVLLLGLGGLGYWLIEQNGRNAEPIPVSETLSATPQPPPPNRQSSGDEPTDPGPSSAGAIAAGDPSPTPGGEPTTGVATSPPSRVEAIDVALENGATVVRIKGNGSFQDNYSHVRLNARPFREVIRISGIDQPFTPSRLEAGTPQVETVRIGFHRRGAANELHVVMDLADQGARVTRIQPRGETLMVWLN